MSKPVGGAGSASAAAARLKGFRWPSAWTLVVFFALAIPTTTGAFVARQGVADEERRILSGRAAEGIALLSSSIKANQTSLGILGTLAVAGNHTAFKQGATVLGRSTFATTIAAVADRDGALVVIATAHSPAVGEQLTGERATLARRALETRELASTVLKGPLGVSQVTALSVPGPDPVVAFLETPLPPDHRIPPMANNLFRDLRGAIYAAGEPDPAKLMLTTESNLPMTGDVYEIQFPVGADRWTVVVGARGSLGGSFAKDAPWILLGVGLLAAALAAAAVETQVRRRAFAQVTVEERTSELEDTRRFLERLIVSGPTAVMRVLPEKERNRVVYVSPNSERVLGVDIEAVIASGEIFDRVHPEDIEAVRHTGEMFASGGKSRDSIEFRMRQPDGEYRWISALWMVDDAETEGPRLILVYLNDVTERRRSEQAIREAQQVAEAANRSKSEFLSRMSHELRTPLNSVLGFGQLLEIEALDTGQEELVDQIMKAGRHLLGLINEVLDISRIESGRLLLAPEAVNVDELVQETVDLIRPLADQREVRLMADSAVMVDKYVFADHQRAKQVLLNLLSNAVKYNRFGGSVTVSCAAVNEHGLRIEVSDTGPGISSENMERLFAPFERLDAGNTDVEGTGIGLTLSRHLTQAMGGTLGVESAVGEGSTFWFELPAIASPATHRRPVNRSVDPERSPTGAARRKVLCIEDNPSSLKLVQRVLARRPDVEFVAAMQASLGVELARELNPALILLDLHLPDIPGEEVLRRLQDDPATASIPVVVLSADATDGQAQRLLDLGASAYITKPIDIGELLSVVDQTEVTV